jgi:superkiller protein 3
LGNALRVLGRLADARASYLEALRIEPTSANTYAHIGITLIAEGQPKDALPWCRQATRVEPNSIFAWEQLAELYGELEEPEEAIPCWERVLALSTAPRASAYIGLGRALQDDGRLAEAREAYRTAASIQPDLAVVQHNLGVALPQNSRTNVF